MEKSFSIPAQDGKRIYGFIHTPAQPTKSAIILVHGLTGHMNEHIHLVLGRFFVNKGYAVLRFNQYGSGEGARVFHESTISLHVSDTRAVVDYALDMGFSKLVLMGHSLGAPVAIASIDVRIGALILVDPSGPPSMRLKEWQTYNAELDISYLDWPLRIILGKQWIEDVKTFPDSYEQFSKVTCPVNIITADGTDHLVYSKRYQEVHPSKPKLQIIPKADHCFAIEGSVENLCTATLEWLVVQI